jgi:DNA polymerase IV (DinB-like DNA polymerase)
MRLVAHVDMDAFFAAIEERDRPELRGRPISIGADPLGGRGRGVVSTANYAARAYGLHSAQPISQAWRDAERARKQGLPPVVFLHPNMAKYATVSGVIMTICRRYADLVEQASIDEAYLDLSPSGSFEAAEDVCRRLKQAVREQQQLTMSVGLAPNKLIAKIASGFRKPDGLTVVRPEEVETFLAPLSVRTIPGIGPKTEVLLAQQRIVRITDLAARTKEDLCAKFGKRGADFYDRARGRDDSPVSTEWIPKSISEQETFATDTRDATQLLDHLSRMCGHVMERVRTEGFSQVGTIAVTVRFADFETSSRAHTLDAPTSDARLVRAEAIKLLLPFLDKRRNSKGKAIRLLGVRVERLG